MKDSTWPNLDGEQYFYSGGSLREYCRKRGELKSRVVVDCAAVKDTQAFQLVYSYRGGKAKNLVDRIRRHYIDDCSEKEHYYLRVHWKRSVDSGYALSKLGEIVSMDKQQEIYTYAKSIGAGFHGFAYELLLHSVQQPKPVVLKMRERRQLPSRRRDRSRASSHAIAGDQVRGAASGAVVAGEDQLLGERQRCRRDGEDRPLTPRSPTGVESSLETSFLEHILLPLSPRIPASGARPRPQKTTHSRASRLPQEPEPSLSRPASGSRPSRHRGGGDHPLEHVQVAFHSQSWCRWRPPSQTTSC
ncbi:hypothetical protein Pcac1_g3759 [Phytophthora cactorum]|nr:hypothetical protein Pcac1_g3759 [Phytophthora cactorum]